MRLLLILGALGSLAAAELAPEDLAVVSARWPQAARLRAAPAAHACFAAAARFARAETREAKSAGAAAFEAGLEALGPAKPKYLADTAGFGRMALDILGGQRLLTHLAGAPDGPAKERLAATAAHALYDAGKFAAAADAARAALKINPRDKSAFAILKLAEGRAATPAAPAIPTADPAVAGSENAMAGPVASATAAATARKWKIITVKSIPPTPLESDPALQQEILRNSDQNPISKRYLSPMIRSGKLRVRLVDSSDPDKIPHAWGTYDGEIARLNRDLINIEVGEYNAHYANDPAKHLPPLARGKRLTPAQRQFIATRFMPLVLHEAAAHAKHMNDLKKILGTKRGAFGLDGELYAWRMHAAYIAAQRKADPGYLTERTSWASDGRDVLRVWSQARRGDNAALPRFLRKRPSYMFQPHYNDGKSADHYAQILNEIQRCRHIYDLNCRTAAIEIASILPPQANAACRRLIQVLDTNAADARARNQLTQALFQWATLVYRLDSGGMAKVQQYYREANRELELLEQSVVPLTMWDKFRSKVGF